MRVLGIDPGSQITGFGVVESSGSSLVLVEGGCVVTKAGDAFEKRLAVIHAALREVLERTKPEHAAVESLFFAKNVKRWLMPRGSGLASTIPEARRALISDAKSSHSPSGVAWRVQ